MSLFGSTDARTGGRRLLSRSAATVKRHDVAVTTRVMEGSPAAVLAEVSQGAAMLVVGAHGHRGLTRALLGSVSKGCLQKAHCPVVVVPLRSPTAEAVLNPPAVASTGS
jgi:nucleotide-binding universal stress UspA family protein